MKRYKLIDKYKTKEGISYITNPIYPTIPETENDIYILASISDRYDKLAAQYYNDSTLWWIIASANTFRSSALPLKPGVQIRIPSDTEKIISDFIELNKNR